jgi:Uncharacterised nucleotidyltransferase
MEHFDKENAFVLLVARGTLSEEERIEFENLLSADLDWDYVLAQLKRHKLFPLFNSHLHSCNIAKNLITFLKVRMDEADEIKNNCTKSIIKSRTIDVELCLLATLLSEKKIQYAILKGPVLANAIYDDPGKRAYGDIDILIKKSDADVVAKNLNEQGYIQGELDYNKGKIFPAPRKNIIWCNVYSHQLYPFKKNIEQFLCEVDVQIKLFHQHGNTNQNIGVIDLSTTAEYWQTLGMIEINGTHISTLNWKYFLLQLCMHAYLDEVSITRIVYDENGVCLRAYCDIRELLISKTDEINLDEFAKLVQRTQVNEAVYYILSNLSELYSDILEIVSPIVEKICPSCLSFMNEFGHWSETVSQQRGQFSQPFMKRIFDNSCREDYERQRHLFRHPNWAGAK